MARAKAKRRTINASPFASVIVPAHNRVELTRRSLYRWRGQLGCLSYEILVVDDASKEDIPAVIADVESNTQDSNGVIRYLRLSHGLLLRSPNAAYRAGFENAEADFIVLSSQDVLVPRYALAGLVDTAAEHLGRRAALIAYWLTEAQTGMLPGCGWEKSLLNVTALPGFWDATPYGAPNKTIVDGGAFILCTGQSREQWEWIGFLRDTPYYGSDDRDLIAREAFLQRPAVTVPDLFCVHQWHPKPMWVRSMMVHPGYVYETEDQARLLAEARANDKPTPLEHLMIGMTHEIAETLADEPFEPPGPPPEHITRLFTHVLSILGRKGVRTIGLANDWWGKHFIKVATSWGAQAAFLQDWGERELDAVISLMKLQTFKTYDEAWQYRNRLRGRARHLLILVPYRHHFSGGENLLQFDESSLQAPIANTAMTGYLVGIW